MGLWDVEVLMREVCSSLRLVPLQRGRLVRGDGHKNIMNISDGALKHLGGKKVRKKEKKDRSGQFVAIC